MASLLIKDRIYVNHMDGGASLKAPHEFMIEDFVPSDTEKDYYAHRLGGKVSPSIQVNKVEYKT